MSWLAEWPRSIWPLTCHIVYVGISASLCFYAANKVERGKKNNKTVIIIMLIPTCSSSCCTSSNLSLRFCWYSGQIRSQFCFCCLKAKFIIFHVPAHTGREYSSILALQTNFLSNKISHWNCFSPESSNRPGLFTWKQEQ